MVERALGTVEDLDIASMAVGGDGVARGSDGRVVFVTGGLPGDRVRAELVESRKRFARAVVVEVLAAGPDRVEPQCAHAAACGGCTLAALTPEAQRRHARELVRDVLVRVGGVADPDVRAARALPESGFRTTLRAAVEDGRAGFRRHRSHEITVVDECLVADPLAAQLLVEGRFGTAREVTIRVGARTGERLVVVDPTAEGVRLPDDVTVVGTDELAAGRRAWYHEEVAGRRWRISAASFFQGRPDAADELVAVVRSAIGERSAPPVLVDAYCGVGLFGGSLPSTRVIAVESSASSAADARHNLAHLDAKVVRTKVERWRPSPADVVVADPARRGLHPVRALERLVGTGADVFVLVSCDAGSLGRDVARLVAAGYEHRASTLVDSFPHTAHVEVVTELVASPLR